MDDSLVSEKTIAYSMAHEILVHSVKIPSIPANARKILEMVRQPDDAVDIPSFVKLVESDPGLFTRIMQVANSTYYKEMERITSLRAAVTRIGLKETIDSVCLHFFQRMLPKFPDIKEFSYSDFWSFSWICACANRRLGHPMLGMDVLPGDLYLAGMLHGLGKLLFAIHFPEKFGLCLERARQFELPLYQVEQEVFGTTDGLVAGRVLSAWNLPANICEGVGFCQRPELAQPEYVVIAALTQYAYTIAAISGAGVNGEGIQPDLAATFLGQRPNLRFSKPKVQSQLLKEIFESLDITGENMVPLSPKAGPPGPARSGRANRGRPGPDRQATQAEAKKPKKGLLSRLKALWTGN